MNEILTAEERIQSFVINNLKIIQQIIKPYRELRDALIKSEPGIHHNEIDEQYDETIKSVLAVYCAKHLQITPLDAIMTLSELDVSQI